jgi:hypothetical protein
MLSLQRFIVAETTNIFRRNYRFISPIGGLDWIHRLRMQKKKRICGALLETAKKQNSGGSS